MAIEKEKANSLMDLPEPLYDNVFVEKTSDTIDKTTGFHVPETVAGRSSIARILAVGPGLVWEGRRIEPTVKPGDLVFVKGFF